MLLNCSENIAQLIILKAYDAALVYIMEHYETLRLYKVYKIKQKMKIRLYFMIFITS